MRWTRHQEHLQFRKLTLPAVTARSGPLTEWFYADGIINTGKVPIDRRRPGIWSESREWLVLLNVNRKPVAATATFYFENEPPRSVTQTLPGLESSYLVIHEMPNIVPPGQLYAVRVRTSAPVIVQPTRGEYEENNPVTQAMGSFVAYPGPLGLRETKWAYADSLVLSSESPLEEREWISILNPDQHHNALVNLRFLQGGEEITRSLTVPAERVRSVDLYALRAVPFNSLAGSVVESDSPVVVEQVRRAYTRGIPITASMWACLAHPVGGLVNE
jgi:hypothetical protein